ncbi:MAG: ribbon-helix-helix protein, CopG family [Thaumarchaeota archaeon]|nr:ribbon-helix-helix protein, CopG family [Nitrososphaerota archaeon]
MPHKYEKRLTVTIPKIIYEELARIAEDEERSIASLIRLALKEFLRARAGVRGN